VKVGCGVSVMSGVPVPGVVVGGKVFSTNKSGVFVSASEKGVTVGWGPLGWVGTGVCKNGIETGSPLHPERREKITRRNENFFITPLQ
jgi:hypothetical protein